MKYVPNKGEWKCLEIIEQQQLHTGIPHTDARKVLHDISYHSTDEDEISVDLEEGKEPARYNIRVRIDIQKVGSFEQ